MPILTPSASSDFEKTHIPAGTYGARLCLIEAFQMPNKKRPEQMDDMLRWSFEVMSKKTQEVKVIEGVTSTKWNAGTPGFPVPKAWRWAKALLGMEPPLEAFDTDDLIGVECKIKVIDRPNKAGEMVSGVDDIVLPELEF